MVLTLVLMVLAVPGGAAFGGGHVSMVVQFDE